MNALDISDEMYKLVRAYGAQEYQRGRSDMYKEMLTAIKEQRDSEEDEE